jgi:hypothetical protein
MTSFDADDFDVDMVTIDENHTWKDEVEKLTKRNAYLEQETQASQLMAAYAILKHGEFELTRDEIAKGLPGYGLTVTEVENGNIKIGLAQGE